MTYSEEGLYFISEQLFNDLESVGAIGDTDHQVRSTIIDNIAETFKFTLDKYENSPEVKSDLNFFNKAGTVMWRSIETLGPTNYHDEEYRDAIIDFIEFMIKVKCESSSRAKELFERCKQLQVKKKALE